MDNSNVENGIENKVHIMTNQKWKTYKTDNKMLNLFKNLEAMKEKHRKEDFKEWLNMNIYMDNEDKKFIQVKMVLELLYKDVKMIIENEGYAISNEKQLRDNIATMIYKESKYD